MHQHEVIRVAQVVPYLELVLYELIQLIEIHVGEELAAQIPDGEAAPILRAEQDLEGRPCAGSLRRDLDLRIDQP